MKLVTFYSPTHESLVKRLLASRLEEYTVVARQGPQLGNGNFRKEGWHAATLDKMRAIREEATEDFVFADADILFLKPSLQQVLKEAEGFDVVFQPDGPDHCTGLFFMRSNPATLALLDNVIRSMEAVQGKDSIDDQSMTNYLLRRDARHKDLKVGRFSRLFANPHILYGPKWWEKQPLVVPSDIIAFHANWIVGIIRKHTLLDVVEGKYRVQDLRRIPPVLL